MNKVVNTSALAVIAASAVVAQVADKKDVNIDSAKVDDGIKKTVMAKLMDNKDVNTEVFGSLEGLATHVKENERSINVDVGALKAATQTSTTSNRDSVYMDGVTTGGIATKEQVIINCYSNCYRNCHGACHGSRGWR